MNEKILLNIRRFVGILTAVFIVTAGICLICGSLSIYFSGEDQPYSREAVAERFNAIAILVYMALGFTALGILLHLLFSPTVKKNAAFQPHMALNRLQKKRDASLADEETKKAVYVLRNERRNMRIIGLAICLLCTVVLLVYSFNGKMFYKEDINSTVISAMYVMVPCLFVVLAFCVFASYYIRRGMKREIELLKNCPVSAPKETAIDKSGVAITRGIILAVGAVFLIFGYFSGGTADVLTKAVNICTECIGLG